jgi:hypothetical protein
MNSLTDPRDEIYPHIAPEFYAWLLYQSEVRDETFDVDGIGPVEVLLADRLTFASGSGDNSRAVITGEDAPASAETKAALISGKVLTEIKLLLRLPGNTYMLTLKGDLCDISSLKQVSEDADAPTQVIETDDSKEAFLLLRMQEYEDIVLILQTLFRSFANQRAQDSWHTTTLQELRRWVHDQD